MKATLKVMLAGAALIVAHAASAQSWPSKPVRIVVPAAPGGQSDIAARMLATEVSRRIGQQFVVENRPGANQAIGTRHVADSPPDGYTFFFGGVTSAHPLFVRENAVDPLKSFAPVSNFLRGTYFLIADAKLPARTLGELVDYSKANPGKVNFGNPGSIVTEMLVLMVAQRTGLNYTVIPFKAATQVMSSMLNGEVAITMQSMGPYLPQAQAGKVRVLMASTGRRSSIMPDVPTAAELGVQDYDIAFANGLWAPAGTPDAILQRLSVVAAAVPKMPEISEQIRRTAAADPDGSTPEEQRALFEREIRFWAEAARLAKFQPQ